MSEFDYRWDNWTGDFTESFAVETLDASVRGHAGEILGEFGRAVRRIDKAFPDEVRPGTFARVMTETMPRLKLPDEARKQIPEVIATFLEYLRDGGRVGEGSEWAAEIRVIGKSFGERVKPGGGVKGVTIKRPEGVSPVGRNDPCPCGSGKKYKKCCMTS